MERVVLPWASLGHLLEKAAAQYGDRSLIRFEGATISFAAANRRASQVANALLSLGLQKGDRVAVMLPNGTEFPVLWLGIARAGLVMVPVNTEYQEQDLEYVLRDSEAACLLIHCEFVDRLERVRPRLSSLAHILIAGGHASAADSLETRIETAAATLPQVDVAESDLINIQYTSGTTGLAKGCMLTHRYWLLMGHTARMAIDIRPGDVHFNAQPFYYMDGQWNLTLCLIAGVPLVLVPRFSVTGFWKTVVDNGVTFFYCLGTMPLMLLNREPDELERHHKVRAVSCSGIVPAMHATIEERFNCPWREGYGTTESGTDMFVPFSDSESVGSGALGKPIQSKEARIVDTAGHDVPRGSIGELLMRGEPMMLGYWRRPEATAEVMRDGWFHTGDLCLQDERGYYHLVGRVKDMVRRSGENISTAEVEGVLAQHPKVKIAAVVPVPDPIRGEEVKAYVVLREAAWRETVPPQELVDFVRGRLAAFKAPRYVQFVEALPMTPSERVEKHKLIKSSQDLRGGSYDATTGKWVL